MSEATAGVALGKRPGQRGRIGVIQPAPAIVLEYEWASHVPDDVMFPVGRVRMTGATTDDYRRVGEAAIDVAADLATAGADVVVFACTVGSLFAGPDAERRSMDRLAAACGKRAIGIADASMRALGRLGARRIAILTPYGAAANELVGSYVTQCGLDVASISSLPVGLADVERLDAAEVGRLATAMMTGLPDADGLWLPCTAVRTLACLDDIEAATGRVAVSGSQALLWDALRTIGIDERLACGALLRQ